MATCAAKNCGKPAEISQAKQPKMEILYPHKAVYNCYEGFSVDGNAKSNKTFEVACTVQY